MKLLHTADLHLGKRVCEYPMLEDQRAVLKEISDLVCLHKVDAVLIAGDVYDRPVPPQEAVVLLSDFLCALAQRGVAVCMIAGNHDSAERLSFCASLLDAGKIHIAPPCEGEAQTVLLEKGGERVAVHMISFERPAALRPYLGEEAADAERAMRAMVGKIDLSLAPHNVLLAHAFVTGGETSDSEQAPIGTVENIPAAVFEPFDYAAMGHLHRPQTIGGKVRYAGSPLAYSFSEIGAGKTVTLLDVGETLTLQTLPLHPVHPMREVQGSLAELLAMEYSEDYIRAVVTDEEVAPDARVTLRATFPNLMRFAVENSHTASEIEVGEIGEIERRDPLALFAEFYEQQSGTAPDEARLAVMREVLSGEVRP